MTASAFCIAAGLLGASAAQEPAKQVEAWPSEEVMAALQQCVQQIGPIRAELTPLPSVKSAECGMRAPILLEAVGPSAVAFRPKITVECGLAPALEDWIERVVQPAARKHLADTVKTISGAGYQCRNRVDGPVKRVSEHGT
ncbi:MAG TPA: extensin family protein [Hyphomicrobiaceae bacterium]|nr:extensin family protein [Hyphomicrobiaceae bacterium]